jgi:hypothetical protein
MTGNPVGLVEFLTQRMDEREALARRALHFDAVAPGQWVTEPYNSEDDQLPPERCHIAEGRRGHYWTVASDVYIPNADHIAANDPAYVLQDIAAKRRIIELRNAAAAVVANPPSGELRRAFQSQLEALDPVIALFAAPFSSHPDWQPEWSTE